jgi:ATP-dependent Clp protease ATP-binding subunit ClpA
MDRERFYEEVRLRVEPTDVRNGQVALPLHSSAQVVMDAAVRLAAERRRTVLNGLHLLAALLSEEGGAAAAILTRFDADPSTLQQELVRAF